MTLKVKEVIKFLFQKAVQNYKLIIRILGFVVLSVVLILLQFSLANLILFLYTYIAIAWKLKSFITFALGVLLIILVVILLVLKKEALADIFAMYGFLVLMIGCFTAIPETRKMKI